MMTVAVALAVAPASILGRDACKPLDQIAQYVRVGVLVDRDRRGRVGAEDKNRTLLRTRVCNALGDPAGDVDELLSARRSHIESHQRGPPRSARMRSSGTDYPSGQFDVEVSVVEQVRIASLALDPRSNQPVVLLKPLEEEPGTGRLLPIWIGHPEATAILLALEGVETPRPMTHDLLRSIVETLDNYVERVEITRVDEGTFYAAIILRGEESTRVVDARPSDSIALAIRTGSPIFVADEVLESAGVPDESVTAVDEEEELEAFRDFLDHVDPADFSS